jgi:CheY-like chemotaxis protein
MAGPRTGEQHTLAGYSVLVVDDEEDTRIYLTTVLEDYGARVETAEDGEQALARAREAPPDLITLDLEMPGKDGVATFIELRDEPRTREIPVCIISGRPEMRKLIYERPATPPPEGYLDKPVDEEALLLNLRKVLALAKRKQAR